MPAISNSEKNEQGGYPCDKDAQEGRLPLNGGVQVHEIVTAGPYQGKYQHLRRQPEYPQGFDNHPTYIFLMSIFHGNTIFQSKHSFQAEGMMFLGTRGKSWRAAYTSMLYLHHRTALNRLDGGGQHALSGQSVQP